MKENDVWGIRVGKEDWDAFRARCIDAGTTRNAALVAYIKHGDPTGNPKRGVGPQKGKTK